MAKSAWITLVEESTLQEATLDDVRAALERYVEMTAHTGQQLGWEYADAAFPYDILEQEEEGRRYLLLKGKDPHLYKHLILGVDNRTEEWEHPHIQLVLPTGSTHGDRAKANEFCRYLAKTFQGKLHLFNGRVMFFYPRKV
ncbi:DUF1885 family protein [Desmospora profundinema]|uniref:DUF1885 family protein n=1 Tax=Desmospora profundinema TaxID=1571184 RepID=A0ABU1IJE5_9BACL|nr:DUF1885 family protein [Desmospora profundinema]MDR6224876.1 hypothetical protein [Desmospora profundinema]